MESEIELKERRGADQGRIASGTKKGNATMELVGVKQESKMKSKLERKAARVEDRTHSWFGTRETRMAATWTDLLAFITFLIALASNGGKKIERARPKDEREDCLSRRANLKFETWIWNVAAVAMCENAIAKQNVERTKSTLELICEVWALIEVRRSRKKIGQSRRNTIGLSGNENDRLLIYWQARDCRGVKRTRTMESIGSKSKTKKNKIINDASYVGNCF
jgi:hypothetical protein